MTDYKIVQKAEGNVDITVDTQINHLSADTVIINENISARLYGDIFKLLHLKKGSRIFLHGRLLGNVKNEGGEVSIFNINDNANKNTP